MDKIHHIAIEVKSIKDTIKWYQILNELSQNNKKKLIK